MARPLAWTLLLILALPMAGVAGDCADCFGSAARDCCACSLCLCCGQGPSIPSGMAGMGPAPERNPLSTVAQHRGPLAAHRRGVFHVPKTA